MLVVPSELANKQHQLAMSSIPLQFSYIFKNSTLKRKNIRSNKQLESITKDSACLGRILVSLSSPRRWPFCDILNNNEIPRGFAETEHFLLNTCTNKSFWLKVVTFCNK